MLKLFNYTRPKSHQSWLILIFTLFVLEIFFANIANAGTLACSVTTAALCTGGTNTIIYRMSNSTNAHAELPSQSTAAYASNVVCCSGVTGLSNACVAPFDIALKLAAVTNSHSQENTQTGYTNNACISVPTGGTITVGYVTDPTTCVGAGFDTTLGTIASVTNSHVGNATAYINKICATGTAATGLPISATLTSSVLDTTSVATSAAGYNAIMWKGTLGTGSTGTVRFQLAAAAAATGPWNFFGGVTCGSTDWFNVPNPDTPAELKGNSCLPAWNNLRYFRYKIQICSNDCVSAGSFTPTVNDIITNWSP